MVGFAGLAALLLAATAAQAQESERQFAERALPRLAARFPGASLKIGGSDPLEILVEESEQWEEAQINLHRIYGYCANAEPADCEEVLVEFIARVGIKPEAAALHNLRVIVRDREYIDCIAGLDMDRDALPPPRQIGEDLYALLVFDNPALIALAMNDELAELGLDGDVVWDLAMKQTLAQLPVLPDGSDLAANAVIYEEYGFLPALLADLDAWREISHKAGPDLFVTAVSDYFVFVGVLPDGADLERFKRTVREDCLSQPRCVTPNVYRFRDGRWAIAD